MRSGCLAAVLVAILTMFAASSGSALGGAYYQFTAQPGYCSGGTCYYLLTDVSNQDMAQTLNVNYTPLLANAVYNAYIPQAYQVTNYAQNLVFSAEWSTGAARNTYMPLWNLYTVTWLTGTPALLKSVADVNARRAAGRIRVSRTSIVLGASIVVNSSGICIRQGCKVQQGGSVLVRLPVFGVYVDGTAYRMLMLDFANRAEAQAFGGNYAANMVQFNPLRIRGVAASWQNVYSLWNRPSPGQLGVGRQVPSPFGWENANANYSPLMNEYNVRTLVYPPPLYTSYAAILGDSLPTSATAYFNFQPIVGQ
jgi:hypothetical protein